MAPRVPFGRTLEAFFRDVAPLETGDLLIVAFSGGADSLALLLGLDRLAERTGCRLHAAHFDHRSDPGSAARASAADELARRLGVPLSIGRATEAELETPIDGPEAGWRRARYRFLERERQRLGGRWIVVAQHRDDQAETVLLRIASGSGVRGLSAMPARRGHIVRPLLAVDRETLVDYCASAGLEPVDDPTNADLDRPRNNLRRRVLPRLEERSPGASSAALAVAAAAEAARRGVDERLAGHLGAEVEGRGVRLPRNRLLTLPRPLFDYAVALLHERVGDSYPPRRRAISELWRQATAGGAVGCDAGKNLHWRSDGDWLRLTERDPETPRFQYTLTVPGEVRVPELSLTVRLTPGSVAPWMLCGSRYRAGLQLALRAGDRVTVRNRRAGDRIQPLGCTRPQRLKKLLIDRKVPRGQRDRLPLLWVDGELAWVPGVTIGQRFRISGDQVWIAEITSNGQGTRAL